MRRTLAALFVAGALASCGGGDDEAEAPSSTTTESTTTTTEATTTTGPTATTAQLASVIARERGEWDSTVADGEACRSSLEAAGCSIAEKLNLLSISLRGQIVGANLSNAVDPEATTYIGAAPAEVEDLVDSTIEASEQIDPAFKAIPAGCQAPGAGEGPGCYEALSEFWNAVDDLTAELDAWAPYL